MKTLNGFDRISDVYDALARLVFGRSIRDAQLYFLSDIPKGAKVLILGGGTGWLLVALLKINPHCQVWYVEASHKMLEKTRKKVNTRPSTFVHFIHGTEDVIPSNVRFNAVITNFYFDLFSTASLQLVLVRILGSMMPDGIVLVSDFTKTNVWKHRVLLTIMYRFFKLACGIESSHLPDWQAELKNAGLDEFKSKKFYGGFIRSSIYSIHRG